MNKATADRIRELESALQRILWLPWKVEFFPIHDDKFSHLSKSPTSVKTLSRAREIASQALGVNIPEAASHYDRIKGDSV